MAIEESGSGVYSIGAVARMLGVPQATLRTWEERYSVVRPERSSGGHRLYSREQVEQLRFVAKNVEEGVPPGDAHRLLTARLTETDRPLLTEPRGEVQLLILLAERDPFSAEFADYFLRTEGYEVLTVLDIDEAEEKFAERSPDVAIVDLLMSGGRGFELCRRIKQRGNSPILAISALESRDEALDSGADAFLQKPLDPLVLISTVKDLLRMSAYLGTSAT